MISMLMVLYDFVTNDSGEISRLNSTSPLVLVAKDTINFTSHFRSLLIRRGHFQFRVSDVFFTSISVELEFP